LHAPSPKAADIDPDALLEALKAGQFYAPQGPEIRSVVVGDDKVIVESTNVAPVIVQGRGSAATAPHGASMTRAEVPLARFVNSPWLRVTVTDMAGRRAWTNPIWREPDRHATLVPRGAAPDVTDSQCKKRAPSTNSAR